MIIDLANLNTTPGNGTPFSPPADFAGDEKAYIAWLRKQFDADSGVRQEMLVAARLRFGPYAIACTTIGPFAEALNACIRRVWTNPPIAKVVTETDIAA